MFPLTRTPFERQCRVLPVILVLAVTGVVFQTGSSQGASARLGGRQISALFPAQISGVAYSRGNKESRRFSARMRANGRIRARGSMLSDRGRWYVSHGRLCMQFTWLSRGKLKCRVVLKKGGWYHLLRMNGTTKVMFRMTGR